MKIIRDKDIISINKNIDAIIKEANIYSKNIIEPTITEFKQVKKIILDYIIEKKRIIYGGFALDVYVKNKNINDRIYEDHEFKDVEFYSFEPLVDLKNICDILHKKKFKDVMGRQAQHSETYTITVNFQGYCDITYMPKNMYDRIPTNKIKNYILIHQNIIFIDKLRVFTDLITSNWILEKEIDRIAILQKYYDLELKTKNINKKDINEKKPSKKIMNDIIDEISKIDEIIFLGEFASRYYKKLIFDYKILNIEIICEDLIGIGRECYKIISNILEKNKLDLKKISVKYYNKYFQFLDKKIEIYYNDNLLLRIYKNNEKCIPYSNPLSKNIKIGTFNVVLLYNLINQVYYHQNKNHFYSMYYTYLIKLMIKAKNKYLKKNNLTILDNSPYKDLIIKCKGTPIEQSRSFRLKIKKRKEKKLKLVFDYNPSLNKKDDIDFIFPNISGNEDKNPKKKINLIKIN